MAALKVCIVMAETLRSHRTSVWWIYKVFGQGTINNIRDYKRFQQSDGSIPIILTLNINEEPFYLFSNLAESS